MPLILFNKPWGVLSQFTDADGHPGLAHHLERRGVYPAGRLDRDSEGLLLLTDDGRLQARIAEPRHKLRKRYLAQVEGQADAARLARLTAGVVLKDGPARALAAEFVEAPDWLWPREPPIRVRKAVPTAWIALVIDEGRNRQVRRMTAAVGLPTLRLVRTHVGPWQLGGLRPGEWVELSRRSAWRALGSGACES
jgi:23S rRNA pseudouridine2457 synthase